MSEKPSSVLTQNTTISVSVVGMFIAFVFYGGITYSNIQYNTAAVKSNGEQIEKVENTQQLSNDTLMELKHIVLDNKRRLEEMENER